MTRRAAACSARRVGLIVHGHRDGNAVGGRPWISAECLARLRAAERVTSPHAVTDVLLSGSGAPGFPSEAEQMANAWRGAPAQLWLDELSTDSAENARQALRWAQALGVKALFVVSSWWHVRLACYYRAGAALGVSVRVVRTRRCRGAAGHLAHELRYLPRALAQRSQPGLQSRGATGDLGTDGFMAPAPFVIADRWSRQLAPTLTTDGPDAGSRRRNATSPPCPPAGGQRPSSAVFSPSSNDQERYL